MDIRRGSIPESYRYFQIRPLSISIRLRPVSVPYTFKAVITIIVTGFVGAVWLGVKAMLGK
jgi:hypothetical protein